MAVDHKILILTGGNETSAINKLNLQLKNHADFIPLAGMNDLYFSYLRNYDLTEFRRLLTSLDWIDIRTCFYAVKKEDFDMFEFIAIDEKYYGNVAFPFNCFR